MTYPTVADDVRPDPEAEPGPWRGIFAIPVTPFHPDLSVDEKSLRRQVTFCLDAGVDGLVYPGVVSEFFTLSEGERHKAVETVLRDVDGKVPVVVGVSAPSTPIAASLARHAAAAGASGVMATLPYVQHFFTPSPEQIHGHFRAIARAAELPIVVQNARIGHTVPDPVLTELVATEPAIRYLKEEGAPSTHRLSMAIATVGQELDGVFAGIGGVHLINELDRGAAGSMPAPPFVDTLVQAYRRYQDNDRSGAQALLAPLAVLLALELLYNISVIKEVLRRRGVIESATCRAPAPTLDAVDHRILTEFLHTANVKPW